MFGGSICHHGGIRAIKVFSTKSKDLLHYLGSTQLRVNAGYLNRKSELTFVLMEPPLSKINGNN